MNSGWYAILRLGILDPLLAGKLGYPEIGVYATIHPRANFSIGIWLGSAPRRVLWQAPCLYNAGVQAHLCQPRRIFIRVIFG